MHSVCAVCGELNTRLKKKKRMIIEMYEKDVRKKFPSRADKGDKGNRCYRFKM